MIESIVLESSTLGVSRQRRYNLKSLVLNLVLNLSLPDKLYIFVNDRNKHINFYSSDRFYH